MNQLFSALALTMPLLLAACAGNKTAPARTDYAAGIATNAPIGMVADYMGNFRLRQPAELPLAPGRVAELGLFLGTEVVTSRRSTVELQFNDGNALFLGPRTQVRIENYAVEPSKELHQMSAHLRTGTVKWETPPLAGFGCDFDLHFSAGFASVIGRETQFETHVESDGSGYLKVFKGELEICIRNGGYMIGVNAGQMITFDRNAEFSGLRKIGARNPSSAR